MSSKRLLSGETHDSLDRKAHKKVPMSLWKSAVLHRVSVTL